MSGHKIIVELELEVEAKLREECEGTAWTLPSLASHFVNSHVKNWILGDKRREEKDERRQPVR